MLVKVARETLNLVTSLDSWYISSCYSIPELVRQRKTVLRTRGDASEFFWFYNLRSSRLHIIDFIAFWVNMSKFLVS
jgi:hypothetical protein